MIVGAKPFTVCGFHSFKIGSSFDEVNIIVVFNNILKEGLLL